MNLRTITVLAGIGFLASSAMAADKLVLKDQKDKISYSIGASVGASLKREAVDVNLEVLHQGIKDALSGGATLLNEEQMKEVMMAFQQEMQTKAEAKAKVDGEKNKKDGEAFLAANKKKEGVKTTASGLQYKVIKDGTGKMPKATDTVKTNYRGTLINGTEFDSSYKRNEPATFPVNGVIKGWTEALQLMKVGSKWQLFIPADLAYGERGAGRDISPNSTLIFEIELLSIEAGQ